MPPERGLAMARDGDYSTVQFSDVSFSYGGAVPVLDRVSFTVGRGWTGIVGPNGSGKTTLLSLAARALETEAGAIIAPRRAVSCEQPTESLPGLAHEFFYAFDERSMDLTRTLELELEWLFRWDTLSHGERKRTQIAVALWSAPELLALDEPTNHIDAPAKQMLREALARYDGIGLLVSHDRDFLDSLCERCIFLNAGGATVRPGGVSAGLEQAAQDELAANRELNAARQRVSGIETEAAHRRDAARSQQRRRSKAGLARKDHDARFKRNLARYTGKDGTGGKLLRQMDGRIAGARADLERKRRAAAAARRVDPDGVTLSGEASKSDSIVTLQTGSIPLGGSGTRRVLTFPDLSIRGRDRILLAGPNGSGKTTLIAHIASHFTAPDARLPFHRGHAVFLPQELSAGERKLVRAWVDTLANNDRAALLSAINRLGSDPERFLQTTLPSPGEARKAIIASGELARCLLLVLDEPTNHLDLPSIFLLETALTAFPGAVLFTTHDERFARTVAGDRDRWIIESDTRGSALYLHA